MEELKAVLCTIMRGGTSKAVFLMDNEVPIEEDARRRFLLAVFGSPDSRQIDGLGGADPLTSKCAIIGPPTVEGADINYSFYQISINTPVVEQALCGNISSAVGVFAIDKGLVRAEGSSAVVKAYNTYLKRIITIEVETRNGKPVVEGTYKIDGVPGTGSRVILDLRNAAGGATGSLLPTGHIQDRIKIEGVGEISASILDFGSPFMFIRAAEIGLKGTELPREVDSNPGLLEKLELIRCAGAELAGFVKDRKKAKQQSPMHPLLVFVSPATGYTTFTHQTIDAKDISFVARAMFMGVMHKTYPGACAFCTGVAAKMDGTVVNEFMSKAGLAKEEIIIGHPGGIMEVEAAVKKIGNQFEVKSARISRTARKIMDGYVYLRNSRL